MESWRRRTGPTPPEPRKTAETPEIGYLSNVIEEFNKRWMTNLTEQFKKMLFSHTELYRKFADDPEFQDWILDVLFRNDYDKPIPGAAGA